MTVALSNLLLYSANLQMHRPQVGVTVMHHCDNDTGLLVIIDLLVLPILLAPN